MRTDQTNHYRRTILAVAVCMVLGGAVEAESYYAQHRPDPARKASPLRAERTALVKIQTQGSATSGTFAALYAAVMVVPTPDLTVPLYSIGYVEPVSRLSFRAPRDRAPPSI
ncbi:MAG TPA: hypothetical protein VM120_10565 [Bryobacteraceae bacterium]|nr:hypothetical protein [Bryobacteraceae bacterium]